MTNDETAIDPTDLVDGSLADEAAESLRAAHPQAAEIEIALRVRRLLTELRMAEVEIPEGFEERLLARVREDETLLDLLNLSFAGVAQVIFELLEALLSMLPAPPPQPLRT